MKQYIEYTVRIPTYVVSDRLHNDQQFDTYLHAQLEKAWHALKAEMTEWQLDNQIIRAWKAEDLNPASDKVEVPFSAPVIIG